jgi:hypothetical protein
LLDEAPAFGRRLSSSDGDDVPEKASELENQFQRFFDQKHMNPVNARHAFSI